MAEVERKYPYVDMHEFNCDNVMTHKEITVQDCEELVKKFITYTETAEQHEFPILIIIQTKLYKTMREIHKTNKVTDQKEARAMFRVVLKAIGKDASEYAED
jgi:hypothetical protein